jgi:hypothetical protein
VLKIFLSAFLLLTATVAGWRVHQRDQLERRAQRAVKTLRYVVDPESDNLKPVSVVYFPNTRALCVEYKNQDRSGTPYVSHAVLLDSEDRVSYEVQMHDDLFTDHCADVYARNLINITNVVTK